MLIALVFKGFLNDIRIRKKYIFLIYRIIYRLISMID